MKRIEPMFSSSANIGSDIQIFNGTVKTSETAGNLHFDFDITNITFGLIIVKWDGEAF